MKINVTIDVPDGDTCNDCDLWWRGEDKRCYCLLFDMIKLERRYKEDMRATADILKCEQCKKSIMKEAKE